MSKYPHKSVWTSPNGLIRIVHRHRMIEDPDFHSITYDYKTVSPAYFDCLPDAVIFSEAKFMGWEQDDLYKPTRKNACEFIAYKSFLEL